MSQFPLSYKIDPLEDPRWQSYVNEHPRASIFHTPAWLQSLRCTYGYQPCVFTTSPPGSELRNGLVLCLIKSRLTGRRMVSLPFSDHCELLVDKREDLASVLDSLKLALEEDGLKYIELRPAQGQVDGLTGFVRANAYLSHKIDLRPSLEAIFRGFHKSCVQGKIRRAEREELICIGGRSDLLLNHFYRLFCLMRQRHELPPQPLEWFRNLIRYVGDRAEIRIALKEGWPIAAVLMLRHKNVLVYKYGCSDARFHNLGGMALLFWRIIQKAKEDGVIELDLGRSDLDNPGLATFKEHLGAVRSPLTYYRYPGDSVQSVAARSAIAIARRVFPFLPRSFGVLVGRMIYRHIG